VFNLQSRKVRHAVAEVEALDRSQAVIEFGLDGTILNANENLLKLSGYSLAEIKGKHHSIFVSPAERESARYRDFWASLNRGEFQTTQYRRYGKNGKELWIHASYAPLLDDNGKVVSFIKFATDITAYKMRTIEDAGKIAAISRAQAVIEFNMDGTIVTANENFLGAVGYSLDKIQGKHHSMFVTPEDRASPAYADFWARLNRGQFEAAEYKRIAKGGREIWIQASYNPIFDLNGKPYKVVKYATDITAQAIGRKKAENARGLIEAVAAGSEEMSASIREISETMAKSRENSKVATTRVDAADGQAQRLNAAAQAMSGIVEMIAGITSQINLLALNATIESARAGEAGRGFAVVASEVKNLANQAKQATDTITSEIDALNTISGDVASSLTAIKAALASVNEFIASTAAAVEEQSIVTSDMSANMQRASAELP
jgi:methyl-accepting chemotaxis protein